jgi:uncharacterized protein (TIGR03435 family)
MLVPDTILDHLSPEQWRSVVAHELCHVRHRDNLIAVVQMFIETVFWFHPLVWWIGKRIFQELERACDEEVLLLGSEPRTYAQAILKVCGLYLKSPLACMPGVSGSNLGKRIEEIMGNRMAERLTGRKKLLLVGTGVAAFALPLAVGMLSVPWLRAQSKSQTPGSSSPAQDITGTWQGSLNTGSREMRVVFKISLEDDKLKAVLYSIDQEGKVIPVSAITRDASTIKITLAAIGGNYAGKLSRDGTMIAGTWSQGVPLPLNLARATPANAWTIPEPVPQPRQMSSDATPAFEVATIKPSKSNEGVSIGVNQSGMFNTRAISLGGLIKFAYDLNPRQIIGAPGWLENEKYDVTGKPDKPGMPNAKQLKVMVQELLADRFQLTFHRDKRELSVYAITVAKSGAKLTKNDSAPSGLFSFRVGLGRLSFSNATMAEFASVLQASILERPVVDQTGLGSARYDFMLTWTPDASLGGPGPNVPPPADDAEAPPDLFAGFQQQLGLKLESTKAPVDVLVIDHLARPSEN